MNTSAETTPAALREQMIAAIKESYTLSPVVEDALRAVERHQFVPQVSIEEAYANEIVVTKQDADGQILSCLSQPAIVGMQLEQLAVQPGDRVLEIGAGTGYHAALLAYLAGPGGHVTAIDTDTDIVTDARARLAATSVGNVEVVRGDGALGHPANGPYDKNVATVGIFEIPDTWLHQLAPDGRVVAPVRLWASVTRSLALEHGPTGWYSVDHQMCGFIPLRDSTADDPRTILNLTPNRTVQLHLNQEHHLDTEHLPGILDQPAVTVGTGVMFGRRESVEWLYLWLTCVLDTGICRMPVTQEAIDTGLVDPMFRWGTMATPARGSLAYLTWRTEPDDHRDQPLEVVVIGHGPQASLLTTEIAGHIQTWNQQFRHSGVAFEVSAEAGASDADSTTRFSLPRAGRSISVIWR
ncbi:methyltransferase, FxLD system [Sciscionella marina]|uniref:methyltransferase, FxLD system n=1 Tax=Sciscionella marina TaxID=508770 RepID=UPI0003680569|nr:methyltransferase, FxLD system [Sciscionella marina]